MALTNSQAATAETVKALVAESDDAALTSIDKALEAGRLLVDAKEAAAHGTWLPFLERAGVQERKAQRLMTLAKSGIKSDTVTDLGGIKAALEYVAKRKKAVGFLGAVQFKGWADVLEGCDSYEEFARRTDVIDEAVLGSDMRALQSAIALMVELHDMFDSEEDHDVAWSKHAA
jgi:hypothetical protein